MSIKRLLLNLILISSVLLINTDLWAQMCGANCDPYDIHTSCDSGCWCLPGPTSLTEFTCRKVNSSPPTQQATKNRPKTTIKPTVQQYTKSAAKPSVKR